MLYRGDNRIQTNSTKNRLVFGLGSSFGEPQDLTIDLLVPNQASESHKRFI
jgi:hypothetical protein